MSLAADHRLQHAEHDRERARRHARGDERWCSIPTIVVSSMEQPPLPQNAVFLAKPFTIQKLQAVIRDGLQTSSHP
jgi:hypothetical protein